MKKRFSIITAMVLAMTLMVTGCGTSNTDSTSSKLKNTTELKSTDYIAELSTTDEQLLKEATNYKLENAQVITNPYKNSPLTAVICFTTDKKVGGTITVNGKKDKDDITGEIKEETTHVIPVYGLYNNATTKVDIKLSDGTKKSFEIKTEDVGLKLNIKANKIDPSSYDNKKLVLISSAGAGALYAFDSEGDVRWYFADCGTLGITEMSNGHLLVPTKYTIKPTYYKSGVKEIDYLGKTYNEYAIPGGQHHETYVMPDGNILVSSDADDLSSVEDCVKEIDYKTGEVIWSLDLKDLIPDFEANSASIVSDGSSEEDWAHNNGLAYDEKNNLVLLSCRHLDSIVAVKMDETPSIAWILGDSNNWPEEYSKYFFKGTGDNFEWFYAQHNVSLLDNGDIMLFDNGTAKVKRNKNADRVKDSEVYSKAAVYSIDTKNMTATLEWEYGKERGGEWYSDWISGSHSVTGDTSNVWITSGSNLYDPSTKSYAGSPLKMFTPGIKFASYISHVVDNKLAYEFKISADTYSALSFRSCLIDMYPSGYDYTFDLKQKGSFLGSLGKTTTAKNVEKIDVSKAKTMPEGTTLALDPEKLSVVASYKLAKYEAKKTALKDSYMLLVDAKGNQKAYKLNSSATPDTDESGKTTGSATVAVTGFVSPEGLTNYSFDVYLVINDVVYNTGNYVNFK